MDLKHGKFALTIIASKRAMLTSVIAKHGTYPEDLYTPPM